MKWKTIDLFAGIGGIRKGFELTNMFENTLSAEIDKYACITYNHLFGEDPTNDVTSNEFKEKVEKTPYDVLLAGFPCQSFSIAGKKEGFKDKTRGTLFYDIADLIERTRPKAFLLENVEGLIRHDKGRTFEIILETLIKELNYTVIGANINPENDEITFEASSFILNSKNFGVPQNRPRVYLMGFDNKRYEQQEELFSRIKLPKKSSGSVIYKNLHDLLDYQSNEKYYLSEGYLNTLKNHKTRHKGKGNGFGYMVVNPPKIDNPISNALLATGGSGKERNLVYDPQDGIGGKIVKNKQTPLNHEGIRLMTPREWGKLQGFIGYAFMQDGIDKFSFPSEISNAQQYKQFGNSVTIPVIEELAKLMAKTLEILESADQKSNLSKIVGL